MRYILIAIAILFLPVIILAGQITFNLDRCVVLNSLSHQDADSKVAIHFALPDDLTGKEIMYAELTFSLPSFRLQADSLFEIRFYPLLAEWSEGDISFDNSEAITDSMGAGLFTVKLADTNSFHFDFTEYIREAVERTRDNFGLIGQTDLLGDTSVRLPDNLNIPIRAQAQIRVMYK
jgi:hypothetical protein